MSTFAKSNACTELSAGILKDPYFDEDLGQITLSYKHYNVPSSDMDNLIHALDFT